MIESFQSIFLLSSKSQITLEAIDSSTKIKKEKNNTDLLFQSFWNFLSSQGRKSDHSIFQLFQEIIIYYFIVVILKC